VRLDVGLLENQAGLRSPAADLGCKRRSKTGRRSLAADLPRGFEPRLESADDFRGGLAGVRLNGRYMLIDAPGAVFLEE
jgi:hypothetical protein